MARKRPGTITKSKQKGKVIVFGAVDPKTGRQKQTLRTGTAAELAKFDPVKPKSTRLKTPSTVTASKNQPGKVIEFGEIDPVTGRQQQTMRTGTIPSISSPTPSKSGFTFSTDPTTGIVIVNDPAGYAQTHRGNQGIFVNKTTGKLTDSRGNPVDQFGRPVKPPEEEKERTLEEQAEDLLRFQHGELSDLGKKFGVDTIPTSFEDSLRRQQEEHRDRLTFEEEQAERQRIIDQQNLDAFKESAAGSEGQAIASLSQGREDAFSASKPLALSTFQENIQRQLRIQISRVQGAQAARQQALKNLRIAQRNNDEAAIEQYSANLAGAEQSIRQETSQLLQDQAMANEEARKLETAQRAELKGTLEILGASGIADLNPEVLTKLFVDAGFSPALADSMRVAQTQLAEVEKTGDILAIQEKQLTIKNLELEMANKKLGGTTAIQEFNYLQSLVEAGASLQEIQDFKIRAGFVQKAKDNKRSVLDNAVTSGVTLNDTRLTQGGASNGAGRIDPTTLITDFLFGSGERGEQVVNAAGESVGVISSPYGADHSNISGEESHNGVDISFSNNTAVALSSGTIIEKGFSSNDYGAFVWLEDQSGNVMQYGHLNVDDVNGLSVGSFVNSGGTLARQETDPDKWGSATGAHTDIRFAGVQDNTADTIVQEYGYGILDGRMNISNVTGVDQEETAILRAAVQTFVNKKLKEGYKSDYPVLTETQLELVNQISDDFNSNEAVSDMIDIAGGLDVISGVFGTEDKLKGATGLDDITAINAFQRMVDPGATVRTDDVTLIEEALPWLAKVNPKFKWHKFKKGDKLPIGVRESLVRVADEIYTSKATRFNSTIGNQFKLRADAANVPFNLIGRDFTVFEDNPFAGVDTSSPEEDLSDFD